MRSLNPIEQTHAACRFYVLQHTCTCKILGQDTKVYRSGSMAVPCNILVCQHQRL